MKVPLSVITGKSPMNTVCSLISPVLAFMKRGRTKTGARVSHVLFLALLDRELRLRAKVDIPRVEFQLEAELAGEVLDRTYVRECLGKSPVEEPAKRIALDRDQIGKSKDLIEVGEGESFRAFGA